MRALVLTALIALTSFAFNGSVRAESFLHGRQSVAITGFIDDDTALTVLAALEKLPEQLDVTISSPGGSSDSAATITTLFDTAKTAGVKVNCYVDGQASSAAFVILQSCTIRSAKAGSRLMTHETFAVFQGQGPMALTMRGARIILAQLFEDNLAQARIVAPRLGLTVEAYMFRLSQAGMDGWVMTPEQAVAAHALDSIGPIP